jgi:hypothetical protein
VQVDADRDRVVGRRSTKALIAAASRLDGAAARGRAGSFADGSRCEESPTLWPSTDSEYTGTFR